MKQTYAVQFKEVSKIFRLKNKKQTNNKKMKRQEFYALKNISFDIQKGEVVGVLGTNGSGKSTLSMLLAGIAVPDSGEIKIQGEQALIAINAGLNNQLTGIENIYYKGALLGLSKKRIEEITEGVISFAELGDFLYQPVKSYSSGMKSRLGFSISIFLNPDIIIIDEALSVGDSAFAAKCLAKINEFKEEGKTIFFVSHSLAQVKSFCTKGLWIEAGELQLYDDIEKVANEYEKFIADYRKKSNAEKQKVRDDIFQKRLVVVEERKVLSKKDVPKKKGARFFSRKWRIFSMLIVALVISGTIYTFIENNNKEYLFFLEGSSITKYIGEQRPYLEGKTGQVANLVSEVHFENNQIQWNTKDGTEVVFDSITSSDTEIRFAPVLDSLMQQLEEDNHYDEIAIISQKNFAEAFQLLGVDVFFKNNNILYQYGNKNFLVLGDTKSEENQENVTKVQQLINEQLNQLSRSEKNHFLKILMQL